MSETETFGPAFADRPRPLLSHGLGFAEALGRHCANTATFGGASRVYVICSRSLAANTRALDELRDRVVVAGTRVGMRPHSLWSEILEVVADARRARADLLVTLGAGSLTDAAKIVSFALANDVETPEDLETLCPTSPRRRADLRPAQVPVVCIPTSLSGGEYSAFAGATRDADGRKYSFSGTTMPPPALVILDPALAATTPARVWLSTGVKAVDHCVETLCSLRGGDGSATVDAEADADARSGLRRLVPGLLRCAAAAGARKDEYHEDPDVDVARDAAARLDCMLGVRDAMAACSRGVPLGASHGIGHQLGPAGVGHGETSCVLLPAVCRYNYGRGGADVARRQDAVCRVLWREMPSPEAAVAAVFERRGLKEKKEEEEEDGDAADDHAQLGDLMDAFVRELGMPRTLKEFGIGEDKLDGIAEHSLHDRWVKTNPAPLDKEAVLEILRMVLE
ncbi:putative Fe-containing alcohol dehydrogenase [Xylariaceae sp. FL0804]|nr:putative Fe-containing alcohol dehydrogenase [Xylariaceae sp. FL0804]